jgi:hypothetical protein
MSLLLAVACTLGAVYFMAPLVSKDRSEGPSLLMTDDDA